MDHVREAEAADPLGGSFRKGWRRAKAHYGENLREIDRARDLSMYDHVLQAKNEGSLLFGLGRMHGERLRELLRKHNIMYLTMEKFVARQRAQYPQD